MTPDQSRTWQFKKDLVLKESLDKALSKAGGQLSSVDWLIEMSAMDLLALLSTNDIGFAYNGTRKPDEKS